MDVGMEELDAQSWAELCASAHTGPAAVRLCASRFRERPLRSAGIRPVAFHDDPPTYAAMLDREGEHPIACKSRIGHLYEDAEELGVPMLSSRMVRSSQPINARDRTMVVTFECAHLRLSDFRSSVHSAVPAQPRGFRAKIGKEMVVE